MPKTEIMVVSHKPDKEWLRWCLESIKLFCSGFSGTTILVPSNQVDEFRDLAASFKATLCHYQTPKDPAYHHIAHQAEKCRADIWCPDADFVLHTDSDCIFTQRVTPEDYMVVGKPVLLMEDYKNLPGTPWKPCVEEALKLPVKYEFMRRHPQVNPIGVYSSMRAHIERVQDEDFFSFVMSRKPDFPWGFSEFNTIGAFAFQSEDWKPKYWWVDLGNQQRPPDKILQFWSHWGLEGTITDKGPHYGRKPLEIIKGILQWTP